MLSLRPTCEHCDVALPPDSTQARICSYECTFCDACVSLLGNVCPNCGGGFSPRPIRPRTVWKGKTSLARSPASTEKVHRPVDLTAHGHLTREISLIDPAER